MALTPLRGGRSADEATGAVAAAGTALLYGSSYVATAIALRGFSALAAAAARGLVAFTALAILLLAASGPAFRPRRLPRASLLRLALLGLLSGPVFIVTMNLAVSLAGAGITAFVAGMYAILAALLAIPLLDERLEPATVAAFCVALVGAALLGEVELGGSRLVGVGVAFLAAVVFGLFLVLSRRWSDRYDLPGPTIGAVAMGSTALVAGALAWLLGGESAVVGPIGSHLDAIAAVVWLGLGPGALAVVLVILAMRRLPARRVSAFLLLNPPTAAIGSWLLLGEQLSALQLLGAALILVAMAAASGLPLARSPARAQGPG